MDNKNIYGGQLAACNRALHTMNKLNVSVVDDKMVLNDYPNARKFADISDVSIPDIKTLENLSLHVGDMIFAQTCLSKIVDGGDYIVNEALFKFALINYGKCFGSDSRNKLSIKKILKLTDPTAIDVHRYMIDMRNKHVAHDDNAFAICQIVAVINREEVANKIDAVRDVRCIAQPDLKAISQDLGLMIRYAIYWTTREMNNLSAKIKSDLEKWEIEDLLKLNDIIPLRTPDWEDIKLTKKEFMEKTIAQKKKALEICETTADHSPIK